MMIKTKKVKPRKAKSHCPICNRVSSGVCIRCIDAFIKLKLIDTAIKLSQNTPNESQTYVFEDE